MQHLPTDRALYLLGNLSALARLTKVEARFLTRECRQISECGAFDQDDLYDLWHACWNLQDAKADSRILRLRIANEADYLWGTRWDRLEELAS